MIFVEVECVEDCLLVVVVGFVEAVDLSVVAVGDSVVEGFVAGVFVRKYWRS